MHFFITAALFLASVTRADRHSASLWDSHFQDAADSESLHQTCYRKGEGDLFVAAAKINAQNICRPILKDAVIEPAMLPKSRLKPEPWTQEPVCLEASSNQTEAICIYTSSTFAHGRGISIVTTPTIAKQVAHYAAFTKPESLDGANIELSPPYVAQALPGRGIGLIANRTLHRGDRIFSHTPAIVLHFDADKFDRNDRLALQRDAIHRLPEQLRNSFLALHGHFGGDHVNDVIYTNSFEANFGDNDEAHSIVLPEISVCATFTCSIKLC
jgi:hypothetical protein